VLFHTNQFILGSFWFTPCTFSHPSRPQPVAGVNFFIILPRNPLFLPISGPLSLDLFAFINAPPAPERTFSPVTFGIMRKKHYVCSA